METTNAGTVAIVVIVIGIIRIASAGTVGCGCGRLLIGHFHVGGDHRLAAARIVGQCAQQISVLIGLINDGIGFYGGVVLCHFRRSRCYCLGTFFTR